MRATDIRTAINIVNRERSVADASRVIVDSQKTGVVVGDGSGGPVGVITALEVLRLALPDFLLQDPSLAATLDEPAIEEMTAPLRDKSLAEVIADRTVRLRQVPEIDPDATMMEIAAVLVAAESPIAVISHSIGDERRFVTLAAVLEQVLHTADPSDRPLA